MNKLLIMNMRIYYCILLLPILMTSFAFADKYVVSIAIVGNEHISTWDIVTALTLPKPRWYTPIFGNYPALNATALQNDLSSIRSIYWNVGFLDVKTRAVVKPLEEDTARVQVTIYIDEGTQYKIGDLKLTLPTSFDSFQAQKALEIKTGGVFSPYGAGAAKEHLWRWIADKGYPYAQVAMDWQKSESESATVDIQYSVEHGKSAYFGKINFKGSRNTKAFILRRELSIKQGHSYSYTAVEHSKEELYATGLFKIVSMEIADTSGQPETLDVNVGIVEKPRGWYGFSLDFGSSPEYDLASEISAAWGHRNIFGNGQGITFKASAEAELFERQQFLSHRYEFIFFEPWTFAIKLPSTVVLYFEPGVKTEQYLWRVQKLGGTLQLMRSSGYVTHWGGATYEKADVYGVSEDQAQEIKEQQGIYIARKLSYTYQRDARDDILMPSGGSMVRLSSDFVGGILGGDEHYLKIDVLWARYQRMSFWRSAIFATRLRIAAMGNTVPGTDVAVHNRLTLGGANTVRGFAEGTIGPKTITAEGMETMLGGKTLGLLNVEIRFPIIWKFYGHAFLDAGQVWIDWKDVSPDDIHASAGLGLALTTPVGPLRLDYGRVLSGKSSPPYYRWHFSLMYPF